MTLSVLVHSLAIGVVVCFVDLLWESPGGVNEIYLAESEKGERKCMCVSSRVSAFEKNA